MNPRIFAMMLIAGVLAAGTAQGLNSYLDQSTSPIEALNGTGSNDSVEQSAALEPALLK